MYLQGHRARTYLFQCRHGVVQLPVRVELAEKVEQNIEAMTSVARSKHKEERIISYHFVSRHFGNII